MTTLEGAESSQRGYVVTSDRRLLAPYERARLVWRDNVAELRRLSDGDLRVRRALDAIEQLIARKLLQTALTLDAHDSDMPARDVTDSVLRGETMMDDVRVAVGALQAEEAAVSDARETTEESRARVTKLVFVMGVLAFVLALAAFFLHHRDERARSQRAEERAALLDLADRFIGVLGHDLRNPLSAMLMAARLIAERTSSPEDRVLTSRIVHSGERMVRMIDEILDLARTRIGTGIPVLRSRGDLCDIVANVVDELRMAHPKRRIEWTWVGDGDGEWDFDRMAQAVSNITANAIEHGDAQKPVILRLRGRERAIELAVHNFGATIPPDQLATLFASYRQPSRATTSKGLGLGLYIADQIVRATMGPSKCARATTMARRSR